MTSTSTPTSSTHAPRSTWAAALALAALPGLAHAVTGIDSDGDGAPDGADVAPCDPSYAARSYFPSETDLALLAFEDQWPADTDLDFNDVVVRVHYRLDHDASGRVARVLLTVDPVALGGRFDNGLGLVLPTSRQGVSARRRVGEGEWSSVALESDADVTVRLSSNLRELFDGAAGQINAGTSGPRAGQRLQLELVFDGGAELGAGQAPFDLFIFRSATFSHQIHFPQFHGTDAMDQGLFGSSEDGSTETRKFVHRSGIPAALNLLTAAYYPLEASTISALFPNIVGFASSGGTAERDFYLSEVSPSAGLAIAATPLEPAAPADEACLLNPTPIADSVSPNAVTNASASFPITVTGSSFIDSTVVMFGDTPLATTFVSSTELTAVVPGGLIANSGSYGVRAVTPMPGGGASATLTFTATLFTQTAPMVSCEAIRAAGGLGDGVYWLDPDGAGAIADFHAYCDQTTDGGGWMLVLYAEGPVTSAAYDLSMAQVMVRGETIRTATQDTAARPVATNGLINHYSQVLFRGGNTSWQNTMGAWVRSSVFPVGTTAPSATYAGVLSASGRTAAYHQRRAWGDGVVGLNDALSLWDANGISSICGGSNTPGPRSCPFFDQSQVNYPYHYDTSSRREVYLRGPVGHPVPAVTSLNPSGVLVGHGATTVTVTGSSFVRGSVVLLDGNAIATTYVSPTQLTVVAPASTFTTSGSHSVSVRTAAPGGGTSGNLALAVGTLGSPGFAAGSCVDVYSAGIRADGRYSVIINGVSTQVYCDMNTDGGGWMLVYYVGSTVTGAHNLQVRQIAVRDDAMLTVTTDAVNRPVPPSGITNTFGQVLYKGGTGSWRNTMGDWVRFSTYPYSSGNVSGAYSGVLSESGRTNAYHHVRGWGTTNISVTGVFSLWTSNGLSNICGGASTPGGRNCPYFNQSQAGYAYHYDTGSNPRELYVR